ncbi:MAG: hypothetical protein ACFFCW_04275 [Candidatus Hodarchaeota archaeon]
MPGLSEDPLPEGAHRPGECPDPENECLLCRVFGSLNHASFFRNYTPPLVNDPENKLDIPQEVNHVLIRTHVRNVHRPDGTTLNFNQQYFTGKFVTYLQFPNGCPKSIPLGFLLNCLERCTIKCIIDSFFTKKIFNSIINRGRNLAVSLFSKGLI